MQNYDIIIKKSKQFNINILNNRNFLEHIINKKLEIKNFDLATHFITSIQEIEEDNKLSNNYELK